MNQNKTHIVAANWSLARCNVICGTPVVPGGPDAVLPATSPPTACSVLSRHFVRGSLAWAALVSALSPDSSAPDTCLLCTPLARTRPRPRTPTPDTSLPHARGVDKHYPHACPPWPHARAWTSVAPPPPRVARIAASVGPPSPGRAALLESGPPYPGRAIPPTFMCPNAL